MKFSELPKHIQERYGGKVAKRSKYNAKRTKIDGISFDSKRESDYYAELKLRLRSGNIHWFVRQAEFILPGGVIYRLDYIVCGQNNVLSFVDVKGVKTAVYRIKKKQVEAIYGVTIEEL